MKNLIPLILLIILFGCKNEPSFPSKITINTDNSTLCNDTAKIDVKVFDQYNNIFTLNTQVYCNDSIIPENQFYSSVPGIYSIYAKADNLTSDEILITVEPNVRNFVSVNNYQITDINSVGLVTVKISYTNISDKTFKYVIFKVSCFNAVNDLMKEEIRSSTSILCQATGFLSPGQKEYNYWEVGYFSGVKSITVESDHVILDDNSTVYSCD
jgi:hypothetical protein